MPTSITASEIIAMNEQAFKAIPREDLNKLASAEYLHYRDINLKLDLYITNQILLHTKPEDRAKEIEKWVNVAAECYQKNDYAGFVAIFGAINCTAVNRLTVTQDLISPGTKATLTDLTNKFKFSNLQKEIENAFHAGKSVVPYLAMYKDKLERLGQAKFLAESDAKESKTQIDFQAKNAAQTQLSEMFNTMQQNISPAKANNDLINALNAIDISKGSDDVRKQLEANSKLVEPRELLDEIKKIKNLTAELEEKNVKKGWNSKKLEPVSDSLTAIQSFSENKLSLPNLINQLETNAKNYKVKDNKRGKREILDNLITAYGAMLVIMTNNKQPNTPWQPVSQNFVNAETEFKNNQTRSAAQQSLSTLMANLKGHKPPPVPLININRVENAIKHTEGNDAVNSELQNQTQPTTVSIRNRR